MSLRKIFSRNKDNTDIVTSKTKIRYLNNKIFCDTVEIEKMITEWTKSEGWKFENFADILELVGVKLSVRLSKMNKKNCSFKCVTANNTEISISLIFCKKIDYCPGICITDENKTAYYFMNTNNKRRDNQPEVILSRKKINKNEKELISVNGEENYGCVLRLDDIHSLKIQVYESAMSKEKCETYSLRNWDKVEEYLIGLGNSLLVDNVYKKIVELLEFSDEEISKCGKILISYTEETIDKEKITLGKILLNRGELKEHVTNYGSCGSEKF